MAEKNDRKPNRIAIPIPHAVKLKCDVLFIHAIITPRINNIVEMMKTFPVLLIDLIIYFLPS